MPDCLSSYSNYFEIIFEFLRQMVAALEPINYIIIGYFFAINTIYLALVIISFFYIKKQLKEQKVFDLSGIFSTNLYKPVSILAPAFNEEATIIPSVTSLLQLEYPDYEIIVINDGSTDRTLELLKSHFQLKKTDRHVLLMIEHKPIRAIYVSKLYPDLIVVDKENGRKADSLNAGINVSRKDLVCAIDSDSVLESNVLLKLILAFVEDENTIAVGGIIRVANNCQINHGVVETVKIPDSFLGRIQAVEYLRAFLFGRVGWDYLDSLLIISGAFGVFDRDAVLKVGGYLHDTVGEDMELVVRLHRHHRDNNIPYRVKFLPEPVCWTEVPEDWDVLGRQRNRWQRGLADTLWRHRRMLFNPKYGKLAFLSMPFFFFFEMLGPIIELFGFIYFALVFILGMLNSWFTLMFLLAAVMFGLILSVASVLCEEMTFRRYPSIKDVMILSLFAFIENFGYRQIHTYWRFKGLIDFFKGDKQWGVMTRKGFGETSKTEPQKSEPNTSVGEIKSEPKAAPIESLRSKFQKKWKELRYYFVVGCVTTIIIALIIDVFWG